MEWIVENKEESGEICPRSACVFWEPSCPHCPKNTGVCVVKFGGVNCPSRSCGIYWN